MAIGVSLLLFSSSYAMLRIVVYIDGSCKGNPGPGGWGVFIPDVGVKLHGHVAQTTNNRMELQAAIEAVREMQRGFFEIISDSQYVISGITQWMATWIKNGFKTSKNKPVENADLWMELRSLLRKPGIDIEWTKVAGHSGIPGNEEADKLASGRCCHLGCVAPRVRTEEAVDDWDEDAPVSFTHVDLWPGDA